MPIRAAQEGLPRRIGLGGSALFGDDEEIERGGVLAWIGRRLRAAALPVLFLACCGYFVWHAIHGERGLNARAVREQQIAEAIVERDRAQSDLAAMERRVQGLRGDRLDRDQLDERARQLLNMVGKDEIVIPYGPERKLF